MRASATGLSILCTSTPAPPGLERVELVKKLEEEQKQKEEEERLRREEEEKQLREEQEKEEELAKVGFQKLHVIYISNSMEFYEFGKYLDNL